MARLIKRPGDIFSLPLSDGTLAFAQWLPDGTARFFIITSQSSLPISEILSSPVAFRVIVFGDTPSRYNWVKLGKAPIPPALSKPQRYAKKDSISGKLFMYFESVERPATLQELAGLETLAVWAHPHIVERLEAQLSGRESQFLMSVHVA